jgi:hypothetical protein
MVQAQVVRTQMQAAAKSVINFIPREFTLWRAAARA